MEESLSVMGHKGSRCCSALPTECSLATIYPLVSVARVQSEFVLMGGSKYHQVICSGKVDTAALLRSNTANKNQSAFPLVLRTPFLLGFSSFATILCLLIGLFWHFSEQSGGIRVSGVNHYILAYAPTTILIWLVAFWRQVDFHVKDSTPWNELSKGVSYGSQSVLLDYVSPMQIVIFWKAVRNVHLPVVVTTLVFTLLKLATLSSTGLLLIQTFQRQQNVTLSLESKFISPFINTSNNTALFDKSLLYTTYGILVQNLTKPFGLAEGLAYGTFSTETELSQATKLEGEVKGFVPEFQCIPTTLAAVLPSLNTTTAFPNTLLQMNDSPCSLRAQNVGLYTLNPHLFRCPSRQLSGVMASIDCPTSVFGAEQGVHKLFALADFRYLQSLDATDSSAELSSSVTAKEWSTEIAQITGIICRLSYSMQDINVTAAESGSQDFATVISSQGTASLPNFSDDDFDLLFRSSVSASEDILGDRIVEGYALEYPDPMFKIMALVAGGSYEHLLSNQAMSLAAAKVSTQLGSQIAHQYLRSNTSSPIGMQATQVADRLVVATISACAMLVSLALVVGMSLCLILLLRRFSASNSRDPLTRAMSLMPCQSEMATDLCASQSCTEKHLDRALRNTKLEVEQIPDGRVSLRYINRPDLTNYRAHEVSWWNPYTVSRYVLALVFILTLAAIATLEALQHVSESEHGFATLPTDTTRQTIFTHYIPAAFFLLLASMYTCLDFNSLLFAPFQRLLSSVNIAELRGRSHLGQVPILAWFRAMRDMSWGAVSSTTAALIGSLLTIVVSGLFEIDTLHSSRVLTVISSDVFVPTWTDSGLQDSGASLISSLTENLNFPYPRGTFDEIAYASLDMQHPTGDLANSSIVLELPAWRAHLTCQRLSDAQSGIQSNPSPFQNSVVINASYTLPSDCVLGGPNGSESLLQFQQTFNFPLGHNTSYLGQLLDLHVGPYDSILGSSAGEIVPSANNDNPLGCPSIGFMYGFVDLGSPAVLNGTMPNTIAVEVCYQQLQSVQTRLTFQNTKFDLDIDQVPQVNESSIQYLNFKDNSTSYVEETALATAFPFRIQAHMDDTFVMFNNTNDNLFGELSNTGDTVDTFFQGVLFGRTPVPVETLKLESNNQTSLMQQGILAFYRRYMAQAISLNMRSSQDVTGKDSMASSSRSVYSADAPTAVVTKRIVQNNTSKIILQVMLGTMLVCGVFTALTVKMHNVLPAGANPCTIWGQMSLWAGSSIYDLAVGQDEGTQEGDKGLTRVMERCVTESEGDLAFKLGWWTTCDGKRWYGIDVVGKKDS